MKCSKYLYYIKKAVCFAGVGLAVVAAVCFVKNNQALLRKLKEM